MKYLLIAGVAFYVIYKILAFFFRAGAAAQQLRNFQEQQKRGFQSNNGAAQKQAKDSKVKGGEYIDYEEVKK
jgi:hypothetical protein